MRLRRLMKRDPINGQPDPAIAPLDDDDHVRGPASGRLILEYGDYECPYSRLAFRAIERVEQQLSGGVRFAFRHFPLVDIHPHALAAASAAEAAALQDRFWDMHGLLYHRQKALADDDLRRYAEELGLDVARFDEDRIGANRRGAHSPRRRERHGVGSGARHPNSVHRRRLAPRRLRGGDVDGGAELGT